MKYEIKQLNENDAVVINSEEENYTDMFTHYVDTQLNTLEYEGDSDNYINPYWKKIIATISPFKLEGLPMLELPNQEEDFTILDKVIEEESKIAYLQTGSLTSIEIVKRAASAGYKAAQNKKYSEEDIIKTIEMAREVSGMEAVVKLIQNEHLSTEDFQYTKKEIIQSLQKNQFPTSVELTEDLKPIKWCYEK